MPKPGWQLEMGARVLQDGRVRFRVYAASAQRIEVEFYPWPGGGIDRVSMEREGGGVWCAEVAVPVGTLYRYRLDGRWGYPDPYSRSQPEGVHGPSQVVDPLFAWSDGGWQGLDRESQVTYELHVGTYTQEGTFDAVIPQLDGLRDLGVTAIELMPICEFPGSRNWGYDGAHRFAPETSYGGADGLRRLVDAAHKRGLGVVLDVVYNHLGPDGDYLQMFVPNVLTDRYQTPWGKAVDFDGDDSAFVRQYVVDNVLYWIHEFHVDGFRLDAVHEMYDEGQPNIFERLSDAVHEHTGRRRVIIAEDERNPVRIIAPKAAGGYGFDGLWVDDFHHSVHVRVTGEHEGYLNAYTGATSEIARLLNKGFLYCDTDGVKPETITQVLRWQLVYCLQNHDQIGNRQFGTRMTEIAGVALYKAAYALLLLTPGAPLLFMGDEYAASTPFLYFTDHEPELAALAVAGREAEFRDFWASRQGDGQESPSAQEESTFLRSKLDPREQVRSPHDGVLRLFRELLYLRRSDPVLREQDGSGVRALAFSDDVLVVERGVEADRKLIVVNFSENCSFSHEGWWAPMLSTAEQHFAGPGLDLASLRIESGSAVQLPAQSTTLWSADRSRT